MQVYTYSCMLLLIAILILIGFYICLKVPTKIKFMSIIIFVLFMLMYTSIFIMFIFQNMNYMYMLKPFNFLYYICIPICGVISAYIANKTYAIKFSCIIVPALILIFLYFFIISKLNVNLSIMKDYSLGYEMNIKNGNFILDIIYFFINILFIIISVLILNKRSSNKIGAFFILMASLVTVISIIVSYSLEVNIFQNIISQAAWILCFNYCLTIIRK